MPETDFLVTAVNPIILIWRNLNHGQDSGDVATGLAQFAVVLNRQIEVSTTAAVRPQQRRAFQLKVNDGSVDTGPVDTRSEDLTVNAVSVDIEALDTATRLRRESMDVGKAELLLPQIEEPTCHADRHRWLMYSIASLVGRRLVELPNRT